MDKILTSEGGYPLRLNDIEDLQQTLCGVLQGIASAFGDGIISGCAMISHEGAWHGSPGYISYKGNIYRAEGNKLDLAPLGGKNPKYGELYWVLSEYKDRTVIYEDGQEEPSRQRYRATLVVSKTPPTLPHFKAYRPKRLGDYFEYLKTIADTKATATSEERESSRPRYLEGDEGLADHAGIDTFRD